MSTENDNPLWESDAEARMLEIRLNGFWNPDYFKHILLPCLNLQPGDKVLDVGAGTGALTLLLARNLPEISFVGIDLTPAMVADAQEQARKLSIQNVEFKEGNALQLPFEDNSFDAAVCQTLLIHLNNAQGAVNEMSRVLKPGGTFMAAEFHLLFADIPIEADRLIPSNEESEALSRYCQMLIKGYRASEQGDLKVGGRVPFLAINAGMNIIDVRINDRVLYAFPPYNKPAEKLSLTELQFWETLIKDPGYRTWLTAAMTAGGGTEADVDGFLRLLPSHNSAVFVGSTNFSFVWLANPILLVTIAQKI